LEFDILKFDLPLTFACLREAASAKAGILKFDIDFWDEKKLFCLFRDEKDCPIGFFRFLQD
jgi:hypothetical protein